MKGRRRVEAKEGKRPCSEAETTSYVGKSRFPQRHGRMVGLAGHVVAGCKEQASQWVVVSSSMVRVSGGR